MVDARLVLTDSKGKRTEQINGERFTIGRRNTNDLQLDGMDISRNHAEIVLRGENYVICDLGSRFGTYVNGEKITEKPLVNRDRIRLGPSEHIQIEFVLGDAPDTHSTLHTSTSATGADLKSVAALLKGLRALGSGRVIDEVLHMVLEASLEVTEAERAFIMLADDSGNLEFKLGSTRGGELVPGEQFKASQQIPVRTYESGETQEVADLLEPELAKKHEGTIQFGIRGAICVPLKLTQFAEAAGGDSGATRVIGVLYLDRKGRGSVLSSTSKAALETLATEATVAIENARLYRESMERARLQQELEIAAKMQQALAPPLHRVFDFFEAAGSTVPCRAIGGDFLDYFQLPNGNLGFLLGDVMGKGPPAAILSASIQGMLTTQTESSTSPASILRRVNSSMLRRGMAGRFATVFLGIVSPDGKLVSCNAGHNYPILLKGSGEMRELQAGSVPIGILEHDDFDEETVQLDTGDTIIVYSDGISEAESETGEQFGEDRLHETLSKARDLKPDALMERIHEDVAGFVKGYPQADDITLLILRFGKNGASNGA